MFDHGKEGGEGEVQVTEIKGFQASPGGELDDVDPAAGYGA